MRRLYGWLAIRPGEGRLVGLLAALFAAIETSRGLSEIAADTLFISRYGADSLPYLYLVLGMVSLVVALGYGAAIGGLPRRAVLTGLPISLALLLAAERVLLLGGAQLVLPVLWLSVEAAGAILLTFLWTVAGTTLDTRQAKRLFPMCTSAAIAGAFGGTLVAGPLARVIGVENLLLVVAGLLVGAAVLTAEISQGHDRTRGRRQAAPLTAELRAGFDYVRGSPLMRLVSVAYVLLAVLFFSVSFPFLRAMRGAFPSEVELATALGLVAAAVTAVAFVVSITLAGRIYARFGVTTAALLLPLVYLAGFALWFGQFTVATAVAVRFSMQVTQRGISNAAWSALYNVVPVERRAQVLAFIDGVPGQLGITLSGVLLIVGAALPASQIFLIGFVAALACVAVVWRIRRRYGDALLASLRSGLAEQVLEGGSGLVELGRDPQVRAQVRLALTAAVPAERRLSAELAGRLGDAEAIDELRRRLDDADAGVRVAAITALAAIGGRDRGDGAPAPGGLAGVLRDPEPLVRAAAVRAAVTIDGQALLEAAPALAADPDANVRAEAAVALASLGQIDAAGRVIDGLLAGGDVECVAGLDAVARLRDGTSASRAREAIGHRSPSVRAAAVTALAAVDPGDGVQSILIGALGDGASPVRRAAASALHDRTAATSALLDVLETASMDGQEAALDALAGHAPARPGVRAWALRGVERATELRAWAMGVQALEPATEAVAFLGSVLEQRERQLEARLLKAAAILGAADATGPILRCLRSNDADVRAQAIEALDAIGDRQLARAFVSLLDADGASSGRQGSDVLVDLAADRDPWIRVLAMRASSERLSAQLRAINERVAADRDPVVRAAFGGSDVSGGSEMPETERTLDLMARMLFLRRVPLFGQLAPEDLQRMAWSATERFYPGGEPLMTEGELGDELIVIVQGSVRVVQGTGDAARVVRTFEAGDHIGELAVLTERPRVATVIAEQPGTRGLVMGGAALRSILRERPDAAMAMLATLADRIGAS